MNTINKITTVAVYILILIWMFIPNEIFFKLIVIMLLIVLTSEKLTSQIAPKEKRE